MFWSQEEIARRLEDTLQGWTSWSAMHQNYRGPWQELVAASGRILQALSYYPTGADRGRPDHVPAGGGRRHAQLGLPLHLDPGRQHDPAGPVGGRLPGRGREVLPVPGHRGRQPAEPRRGAADHVRRRRGTGAVRTRTGPPAGLARQRPVRVGNGAWNQRQLDVYGELLDAAATLPDISPTWHRKPGRFLADAADTAAARWQYRDHGIWEVRGDPRHYLHSKLMCWVAVDRAITLAGSCSQQTGSALDARPGTQIAASDPGEGMERRRPSAYTQAYGSDDLDASALMLSIVGFLPADDPRHARHDRRHRAAAHRHPGPRVPLPGRRRHRGGGGHVPAVHLLAGPCPGPRRAHPNAPGPFSSGPPRSPRTWA